MLRALGIGIVALIAGGYAIRSIATGVINLGTEQLDIYVRFAVEPGLFVFGVVFMLVLCIGGLLAAYKLWNAEE